MVGSLKRIPLEYIVNDRETRLQVLAGIIDTDGHIAKMNEGRRVTISSSKELFAQQIFFLARSLGYATTINRQSKKELPSLKMVKRKIMMITLLLIFQDRSLKFQPVFYVKMR